MNHVLQDGRELPKAIGFEVEEEVSKLPQAHPSFFVIDGVKDIVLKFIQQYYEVRFFLHLYG